jgi:hypothetical protein
MSKRTNILYKQVEDLVDMTKIYRQQRNALRDDYALLLAEAEDNFASCKAERDERLAKLNELRALEGLPPLTVTDIRSDG